MFLSLRRTDVAKKIPKQARGPRPPLPSKKSKAPPPKAQATPKAKPRVIVVSEQDRKQIERIASFMATLGERKAGAVSRRKAAQKEAHDRHDAVQKYGADARVKGHPDHQAYLTACSVLVCVQDEIRELQAQIDEVNATYDHIAEECRQKRFAFAELDIDDLIAESNEPGRQMGLEDAYDAKSPPGPEASWRKLFGFIRATETLNKVWLGWDWEQVARHMPAVTDLRVGSTPVDNPFTLARYVLAEWKKVGRTTKDRENVLPKDPAKFYEGLWALVAAAARGAFNDPQSEQDGADSSALRDVLCKIRDLDIDAWLALVGGKDSDLNKVIA